MALSILNGFDRARIVREPFTYLVIENAYPDDLFRHFRATYPSLETVSGQATGHRNNHLYLLGLAKIRSDKLPIPQHWIDFFEYHSSKEFFHEVLRLLGPDLRRVNPKLESWFGKKLEDLPVVLRDRDNQDTGHSIAMEVQFGINSPVTEQSSVRGSHVDSQYKLINALWYMREDEDDSTGGEFITYRYKKGRPVFEGLKLNDDDLVEVERVPYRPNTLLLFLNSAWSAHGVGPRPPTKWTRKYVNFNIESYNIHDNQLFARPQKASFVIKKKARRVLEKLGI